MGSGFVRCGVATGVKKHLAGMVRTSPAGPSLSLAPSPPRTHLSAPRSPHFCYLVVTSENAVRPLARLVEAAGFIGVRPHWQTEEEKKAGHPAMMVDCGRLEDSVTMNRVGGDCNTQQYMSNYLQV